MTRNKHFRSVFAALLCTVLCMTAFATVAYPDGGSLMRNTPQRGGPLPQWDAIQSLPDGGKNPFTTD